jgi:Ca2+-binding RTX toxin-like protein
LLGNDTDADGNPLTIASVLAGSNGIVVLNQDGTVTFTPTANFNGAANFSYIATDGTAQSNSATVTVNMAAANDSPTGLVIITGSAIKNQTLTSTNSLADSDGLGVIAYQWLANGTEIAGATGTTLLLVDGLVGKTITAQASYTDQQGNYEKGISSPTNIVTSSDVIEPTVTSFSPVDGATAVAIGSNIDLTFSEAIQKGTGFITIHSGSADGAVVESFDAASSNRLVFSGSSLTIDPSADLSNNTQYFVTFAAGSVQDLAGNNYAGTTTYDFTTVLNTITGKTGNDKIVGTKASDILNGGKGADTMKGGLGGDIYFVDNKGDVVIENKGAGTDTVNSSISFILGANLENLTLVGNAAIKGTGNALNNTLIGNSAANKVSGLAGNDILNGGLGKDSLTGGTGKDVFDFNSVLEIGKKTKGDLITDFSNKQDKINLFDIDANTSNVITNDAFKYIGEKAFTGKAGELHFIKGVLSGDINGDKVADFDMSITLVGVTTLVSQDFVL